MGSKILVVDDEETICNLPLLAPLPTAHAALLCLTFKAKKLRI